MICGHIILTELITSNQNFFQYRLPRAVRVCFLTTVISRPFRPFTNEGGRKNKKGVIFKNTFYLVFNSDTIVKIFKTA